MDNLPEDCLYMIFCNLSLKDQVASVEVCQRFRNVMGDMIWRKKYEAFNTNGLEYANLNCTEYKTLFSVMSFYIKKLIIADTKHLAFTAYLSRYTHRPELSYYLSFQYSNLIELNCEDSVIHDGHIQLIAKNCPKIQILKVSSKYITGEYMCNLSTLQQLVMPNCSLTQNHFMEVIQNLHLTHLNIRGNEIDIYPLIELNHPTLIHLTISMQSYTNEFRDNIKRLTNMELVEVVDLKI